MIRGAVIVARGHSRAVRLSATTRPAIAVRSTRDRFAASVPPAKLASLLRARTSIWQLPATWATR